jgi:hypothetical protein
MPACVLHRTPQGRMPAGPWQPPRSSWPSLTHSAQCKCSSSSWVTVSDIPSIASMHSLVRVQLTRTKSTNGGSADRPSRHASSSHRLVARMQSDRMRTYSSRHDSHRIASLPACTRIRTAHDVCPCQTSLRTIGTTGSCAAANGNWRLCCATCCGAPRGFCAHPYN